MLGEDESGAGILDDYMIGGEKLYDVLGLHLHMIKRAAFEEYFQIWVTVYMTGTTWGFK